jgi:uncharacterized membrane protein
MQPMDDIAIARALHVLAVVIWIGGLSMVTTIVLPLVRRHPPAAAWALFKAVEQRFAWQARSAVVVVGVSGLYLVWGLDLWDGFRRAGFWWMHAMVVVWLVFAAVLFVAEPLGAEYWLQRREQAVRGSGFALLHRLHWLLLALSVVTVLGALLGSAGVSLLP